MRKFLSFLALATLLTTLLVGCSGSPNWTVLKIEKIADDSQQTPRAYVQIWRQEDLVIDNHDAKLPFTYDDNVVPSKGGKVSANASSSDRMTCTIMRGPKKKATLVAFKGSYRAPNGKNIVECEWPPPSDM